MVVAYQELRPLMPNFVPWLSTADRLRQQFTLAVVYFHELTARAYPFL